MVAGPEIFISFSASTPIATLLLENLESSNAPAPIAIFNRPSSTSCIAVVPIAILT